MWMTFMACWILYDEIVTRVYLLNIFMGLPTIPLPGFSFCHLDWLLVVDRRYSHRCVVPQNPNPTLAYAQWFRPLLGALHSPERSGPSTYVWKQQPWLIRGLACARGSTAATTVRGRPVESLGHCWLGPGGILVASCLACCAWAAWAAGRICLATG